MMDQNLSQEKGKDVIKNWIDLRVVNTRASLSKFLVLTYLPGRH